MKLELVGLVRTAPPHKTPLSSVWGRAGRPSRRRPAPPGLPAFPGVGPTRRAARWAYRRRLRSLPGPDRRAPKQANISSLTRLYTALQSAPPRALRHRCSSGTYDVNSTPTQLRRAWFRPAESLQGSLRSPIGTDAAAKSTQHDEAANLVTQACSGRPLGDTQCRVSRHSGILSSCG